jgi:hypothetical protein
VPLPFSGSSAAARFDDFVAAFAFDDAADAFFFFATDDARAEAPRPGYAPDGWLGRVTGTLLLRSHSLFVSLLASSTMPRVFLLMHVHLVESRS